ncbi:inositol monophosphatase family protein [candidate division KSB1 bacterium]
MSRAVEIDIEVYRKVACYAAEEAGKILMNGLKKRVSIEYKGRIDLVTNVDKESQECILSILQNHFPNHDYLAEEEENHQTNNSEFLWVIDPLDGTTNYSHGYNCFSISIALLYNNEIILGIVYDPWSNELFHALHEKGAYLNNAPIKVSEESVLERSLLVTGFPYDIKESSITNLGLFNHLIMKAQAVRRDGSAALDLAYLAAGRFDGFWELKLHPWDVAAGALIVREAGGIISDFAGNEFDIKSFDVLATNEKIHKHMIRAISEIPRESW